MQRGHVPRVKRQLELHELVAILGMNTTINDFVTEWWFPLIPGVYRNSGHGRAGCGGWVRPPVMGGA